MAMGKAVVSTTIGAEGIEYTNVKNIMIGDKPEEFYSAIKELYENPALSQQIGRSAKDLINDRHNTDKIIQRLVTFYQEIL